MFWKSGRANRYIVTGIAGSMVLAAWAQLQGHVRATPSEGRLRPRMVRWRNLVSHREGSRVR